MSHVYYMAVIYHYHNIFNFMLLSWQLLFGHLLMSVAGELFINHVQFFKRFKYPSLNKPVPPPFDLRKSSLIRSRNNNCLKHSLKVNICKLSFSFK